MIDDYPQGTTPAEGQSPVPDDVLRQVARDQAGLYDDLAAEGLSDEVLFEDLGLTPPEQLARDHGPDIDEPTSTTAVTVDAQELVGRGRYIKAPNDPVAVRRTIEAAETDPNFRPTISPSDIPRETHPDAHDRAAAARAELLAAVERSRPLTADETAELEKYRREENPDSASPRPAPPIPPTPPRRPTTE